jgi:transposase
MGHPAGRLEGMSEPRFKRVGIGSFYGDPVYARAVPERHILRRLERAVDWQAFTDRLVDLYKGKARVGRPPYDPSIVLKMLVLANLYGLSDRATQVRVNDSLSAKWFLGLAVDEPAPSASTLTAFRRRVRSRGGEEYLVGLLDEITAQAAKARVHIGSLHGEEETTADSE